MTRQWGNGTSEFPLSYQPRTRVHSSKQAAVTSTLGLGRRVVNEHGFEFARTCERGAGLEHGGVVEMPHLFRERVPALV